MLYIVLITQALLKISIVILFLITIALVGIFITDKVQQYYKNWQIKKRNKKLEQQYEMFVQRVHERKLREIDKRKYPLFYWRELIEEKLEDGNF